jgi:D-alanyl-D-alanine carboxypeptidase
MKKIFTIILIALDVFAIKAQNFNAQLASMLQDTLNTYVSQISNIKGMSASVYIPGQGVWTGVSGNSYTGQAITSNMRFGIASNSKLFCSVMMLKLAENNIISLEDSLKDWLIINNSNINPNITIRQLLNHTSGISDPFSVSPWFDTINANPTRVFKPNEVLAWIGAPLFYAGTSYGYSNTNYILAGMVAESASGYSLAKLIRDSILTPLNLNNTFVDVEEPENGTLAHRWWNTKDYHDTSRVGLNSAVGYAGSIFSTSSDMVKWYDALFNGKIINQSSMNEMTTFITTQNPNSQYGLGLNRDITQGLQYWGHGGSTWGYKSKMIYDTCLNVAVAGLSNSFPAGMDGVTFLLYRVVKNHIPKCSGSIDGPVSVCEGTNSLVYSVPLIPNASSYSWTLPSGITGTSNTNSIFLNFGIGAQSGNIKVTGINNFGMGGSSSIWVDVNPIPPKPIITLKGDTLISNAKTGNQWYNSNGIIQGAINSKYIFPSVDNYYCIVTSFGCSSDTSNKINTVKSEIHNSIFHNNYVIYPNPSSSYVVIQSDIGLNNATIEINNYLGQTVKIVENIYDKSLLINIENLQDGFYFVKIIEKNHIKISKKITVLD